jgi:hypothetical protein
MRGDRSHAFVRTILQLLDDEKHGRGSGPSTLDCLFLMGHVGVSADNGATIYGFHPDRGSSSMWQFLDNLKAGEAFPGVVRDDTALFSSARQRGLAVSTFSVILPEPRFLELVARLDAERAASQYSYGFPNGNGDCNCVTWLERLGLPLLTGRMDEFAGLLGVASALARRFGACV